MTRPRADAPGLYFRMANDYDDDESVWQLSIPAELLFVRGIAYSKRKGTDGRIPATALARVANRWTTDPLEHVAELVNVGLWDTMPDGDGWCIRNFSPWQVDTIKQAAIRQSKREAGLVRGHNVGSHDEIPVDDCPKCRARAHAEHMLNTRSTDGEHPASYIDKDIDGPVCSSPAEHMLSTCSPNEREEADAVEGETFGNIRHIPKARVTEPDGRFNPVAAIRANHGLSQPVPKGLGLANPKRGDY